MKYFKIFLVLLSAAIQVHGADMSDSQSWFVGQFTGKFSQNLSLWGQVHYRYQNDMDRMASVHSLMGISYKSAPWLSIAPFLRTVHSAKGPAGTIPSWSVEYRPSLDATVLWSFPGIQNRWRNRFERRIYPDRSNAWSLRQQLEMRTDRKWTKLALQPFISDEVFYQKDRDGFYRNWLTGGVYATLAPIKLTLFTRLQSGINKYAGERQMIYAMYMRFDF